jgi:hypothetical protein
MTRVRRVLGILLLTGLLSSVGLPVASARPRWGEKHNNTDGWIVWGTNSMNYAIRMRCHWYTKNDHYWRFSWKIRPDAYKWTTSDSGGYGDFKPLDLKCTWRRAQRQSSPGKDVGTVPAQRTRSRNIR